jgi:hypothetical protein
LCPGEVGLLPNYGRSSSCLRFLGAAGSSLEGPARWLGHSSTRLVYRVYSHLLSYDKASTPTPSLPSPRRYSGSRRRDFPVAPQQACCFANVRSHPEAPLAWPRAYGGTRYSGRNAVDVVPRARRARGDHGRYLLGVPEAGRLTDEAQERDIPHCARGIHLLRKAVLARLIRCRTDSPSWPRHAFGGGARAPGCDPRASRPQAGSRGSKSSRISRSAGRSHQGPPCGTTVKIILFVAR